MVESVYRHMQEGVKHNRSNLLKKLKVLPADTTIILAVIGFLTGRVTILDVLAPFGTAFLISTSLSGNMKRTGIICTSIILGGLTRFRGYESISSMAALILIFMTVVVLKLGRQTSALKAGIYGALINLSVNLASSIIIKGTLILFDALTGTFNSLIIVALVYIYNLCIPVVLDSKRRNVLSNEELICISIVIAIVISGLSDIYIYKNAAVKAILSVFVIISVAFGQGAGIGAAIGTVVGLITCMSSDEVPVIIGTYGFCGLLSGLFKDTGKIGSSLGFIAADLIIYLYMGGKGAPISALEAGAGLLLFNIIPYKLLERMMPFISTNAKNILDHRSYVDRMKDMVRAKIMHITDVFAELSKALEENEADDRLRQNREVNAVINSVVGRVCSECDARNICWERDLYCTYQSMFQMIDVIQSDGKIDMETLPVDLKKKCLKANQIVKYANYIYDVYKLNYKWRQKISEGKKVVGEQLSGTSQVLRDLSREIMQEVEFKGDIEQELAVALDREGIELDDIAVVRNDAGRLEVNVYKKACFGQRECIKDIGPAVSRALKKKMKRDNTSCVIQEGADICHFKLIEAVKYQISTGIARAVKDAGGLSGDNYSFIELNNGKYMMALSDGMGTGPAAAVESNFAITLLEKYMEAGFDRSIALKAINSCLSLKSPDDNFATIDLALADLYTGDVEFIKIGAAATFIKRMDGSIETISTTTLPIGILNNVDIESKTLKLAHGDLIIMVTDGVQEAGSGEELWIVKALEEIESRNPQQVAEELLEKARNREESGIKDDMTVLVSKIWEVV